MGVTLEQAQLATQDKVVRGVIETLRRRSPLLKRYEFVTLLGNALAINREDPSNPPSVDWRQVGGVWTESVGNILQVTFPLKILGGDCDVDNFLQTTRSDKFDLMKAQIKMKAKKMAYTFDETCIYGDSSVGNSFDGYHKLVDSSMQFHAGTDEAGGVLTLAKLDEAIDAVGELDKPSFILANMGTVRRLNGYLRGVGSSQVERDEYGDYVEVYRGIPILGTYWITQTETCDASGVYSGKTGGALTSVFVVFVGEGEGIVGLQNGGIQKEFFPKLENKDGQRTRLKWYVGQALYNPLALARIDGITTGAVTA